MPEEHYKTGIEAHAITAALHAKHKGPEWATFSELRDSTGFGHARTIDVATFNTWKSSRYLRIAYEVKVSRGDFLKELDQPQKHAWVEDHFHETYFAAPAGLIKKSEVPENWGLMEVSRKKSGEVTTRRSVRAKRRAPQDPTLGMTLSILRRAAEQVAQEKARSYIFEGQEVTPDMIRERVAAEAEQRFQAERLSIDTLREAATRDMKLAQASTEAIDYLAVYAQRFGVVRRGLRSGKPAEPMTTNDVEDMIEEAVRRRLQVVTGDMRRAHATLGQLVEGLGPCQK